jgi:hypothetical protein
VNSIELTCGVSAAEARSEGGGAGAKGGDATYELLERLQLGIGLGEKLLLELALA